MGHGRRIRTALAVLVLGAGIGLSAGCVPSEAVDECAPRQAYAPASRPTRLAINHDAFDAKHVGHTADGRQFFLTTPFDVGTQEAGSRFFVALYLFDGSGRFLRADINAFTEKPDESAALEATYDRRLQELGAVTFDRIVVEPFSVERFGLTFGLIVKPPESVDDIWWITVEPGDYMAFSAPWDCGVYDT
ncbi:hypothetical protein [Actinoplanes sp. NPDC049599]|uniref:hypothetical protein n=1 Tax=Actinoplanes sp. NPDC049599 TaxID=3363903 RepID=UPI00379B1173